MGEVPKIPESDGERWLRKIDRSMYADREMTLKDGTRVKGADFPSVCGKHAIELFHGIDDMPEDDPDYGDSIELAQSYLDSHFGDQIKAE